MTDTPDPDWDAHRICSHLHTLRREDNILAMARFGIVTDTALGMSNPQIQAIAKRIGRNHERAKALWRSDIREAQMLALYTAEPKLLAGDDARRWAAEFKSWEIVDTAADLFVAARLDQVLVAEFAADTREFVRRTAFAMIAGAAVHLKTEPDATFLAWLPLIEAQAGDPRNFVRKAVNWALRNIGRRNRRCHAAALALAERLAASPDKTRRWIGRDAARALTAARMLARLKD